MEKEQVLSYLWSTAYYLIKEKGYKLIQIQSQKQNNVEVSQPTEQNLVLHLIQRIGKEIKYIRLAFADFVWSSVVERNVKEVAATAELFRKKFKANKIDGLSLFFFPTSPMADILSRIDQFGKVRIGKTTFLQSVCVDLEHGMPLTPIVEGTQLDLSSEELIQLLLQDPRHNHQQMQELLVQEEQRNQEVRSFFFRASPIFTYIFIGINLLMFLILTLNGGSTDKETLFKFGAKFSLAIVDGDWWRLFTSMFLHIGFVHLAFNCIALYYLGGAVERMYGPLRYTILYLIAGIIGSMASFAFNDPFMISAGASGAIYGCFGALLYFGVRRRDLFFQTIGRDVLIILGINLAISLGMASIDLYAHLGGLFGGFLAAVLVGLPQYRKEIIIRLIAAGLLIGFIIWGWHIGVDLVYKEMGQFLKSFQ